jgi:arylsulfatase A-like enzyme
MRDEPARAASRLAADGRVPRRRPGRRALAAAAVVAVVAAAVAALLLRGPGAAPGEPAPASPAAVGGAPGRDIRTVVVISMDTTRWDVISAYGAPALNSPSFAGLARDGVVFEDAYTPVPSTLPAHTSLLTGKDPLAHGVFDNGRYRLADRHRTLAEVLRARGFATAAFVSAQVLAARFGLARGFDRYDDDVPPGAVIGERRGDATTARAVEWLERHAGERTFLFLHLFDPHAPYAAPEPFASEIRKAYAKYPPFLQDYVGEVAFADHCVGRLVAALKRLGVYDNAVVVVTADHGESHGEHGENTHGFFVYTSTVRVPLVVRAPGVPAGRRVRGAVAITDVPTTVAALVGAAFDGDVQGRDLTGVLAGREPLPLDRAIVSLSLEPRKYGGTALLSLVAGDRHYIRAPRPELYDLTHDVYERVNLADSEPAIASRLRARLDDELARPDARTLPERLSVDAETRAMLETLGYVADDATAGGDEGAAGALDPKDLVEYHKAAMTAIPYRTREKLAGALAAAERMVALRPGFFYGHLMLARVLDATGRRVESAAALARARALAPPGQELSLAWTDDPHAGS